jgi:hypothetical protein
MNSVVNDIPVIWHPPLLTKEQTEDRDKHTLALKKLPSWKAYGRQRKYKYLRSKWMYMKTL